MTDIQLTTHSIITKNQMQNAKFDACTKWMEIKNVLLDLQPILGLKKRKKIQKKEEGVTFRVIHTTTQSLHHSIQNGQKKTWQGA